MESTDDTLAAPDQTLAAAGESRTTKPRRSRASLQRGDEVGRYSVLSRLGAGGMGVVYAAYDPELDRRVAIKLLLADAYGSGGSDAPAQQRLVREARALARLTHPNVVAVHDVGTHGDGVFVAMEFVDGETLTDWMHGERSQQEILDVFARAGRGLAAAHEAGLVHRDFKPDNVMIGNDRRVRVMDFGLARAHDGEDLPPEESEPPSEDARLTRTGAIMGTPKYMAPEQHRGEETDARTDQFAFCVALHEALYGQRPFPGDTVHELALSVTRGELRPVPADAQVPAWLRAVVVQGLEVDPARRHRDMRTLLAALADDPAVRRRRWVAAAGAGTLVVGLVGGAYGLAGADRVSCPDLSAEMESIWPRDRREAIASAFRSSGHPRAGEGVETLATVLGGYAEAWAAQRVDACEATHERGEQSAKLLDLRMACLERRRHAYEGMLNVLAEADEKLVDKVLLGEGSLPPLEPCSDPDALLAAVPPPEDPAVAVKVTALEATLAQAGAYEFAGRYPEALKAARGVAEQAAALGYAPLEAEALYRVGALEDRTGEYEQSERDLETSYFTALAAGHLETAVDAATKLIHVTADELGHDEAGLVWARHGEAVLARFGSNDRQAAWLHNNAGNVQHNLEQYDAALASFRKALERMSRVHGEDHADLAVIEDNLGRTARELGDLEAAEKHHRRALAIREATLGEDHPHVAGTLRFLSLTLREQGRHAERVPDLRRALQIRLATVGPAHRQTAEVQLELARALHDAGEGADEARELARAARRIYVKDVARSNLVDGIDALLAELGPGDPPGSL